MGSLPLTLGTGILVVAVLTPSAYAADGGVSVAPSAPAPGGDVAVRVSGCDARTGTAVSEAFAADGTLSGPDGTLGGRSRISQAASPGPYDIRVTCGDTQLTGTVTVTGADSGAAPPTAVPTAPPSSASPATPVSSAAPPSPVSPASAASPASSGTPADVGAEDTAYFASVDTHPTGPGLVQAIIGFVLVGVAAVAVGLRSVRRKRDGKD
ncbi:hypothetical protein ACWD5R_09040 [Streptomyces sp. NPDC002514]|uniref:hypothetical protein n=1 Tax=Streptomyces sp. NPDC001270 TaxID=3364554 RepID=UPI0036C5B57D